MQAETGSTPIQHQYHGKSEDDAISVADSAYQSMTRPSTSSINSLECSSGSSRLAITPKVGHDLLLFEIAHDPEELEHFHDIRPRIRGSVFKISKERHAKSCAIQPMVLGRTASEAKLHIVIWCEPRLEDALNEMFASPPLHNILDLPRPGRSLGFLVCPDPPLPVNAQLDIDVCCQTNYASKYSTHCGAPTIFRHRGNSSSRKAGVRQGTFGGIIKVAYAQGGARFYGMTAGHVIADLRYEADSSHANESNEALIQKMMDVGEWISDDNVIGQPLDTQQLPGVTAGRAEVTHDWTLFEVQSLRPNRAVHLRLPDTTKGSVAVETHPILVAAKPSFRDGIADPVLLLGTPGGTRRGEFSNLPADLWLENNECFVDAYVLCMSEGKGTSL